MIVIATDSGPETPDSRGDLVVLVDSLKLYLRQHGDILPEDLSGAIERLPSRPYILSVSSDTEVEILTDTVSKLWLRISGNKTEDVDTSNEFNREFLDGNYWLLPGEILVHGFNHFTSAKRNKLMFCSVLGINAMVFEKKLHEPPERLLELVLANGGVRAFVDRDKGLAVFQTNERSWPWVRRKLHKLALKRKVARVLDPRKPYEGWSSGVPVLVG